MKRSHRIGAGDQAVSNVVRSSMLVYVRVYVDGASRRRCTFLTGPGTTILGANFTSPGLPRSLETSQPRPLMRRPAAEIGAISLQLLRGLSLMYGSFLNIAYVASMALGMAGWYWILFRGLSSLLG